MTDYFTPQGLHLIPLNGAIPIAEPVHPNDQETVRQRFPHLPRGSQQVIFTVYDQREGNQESGNILKNEILTDGETFTAYQDGRIIFHDRLVYGVPHDAFALHDAGSVLVANLFVLGMEVHLYTVTHRLLPGELLLDETGYQLLREGLKDDMNWVWGLRRIRYHPEVDKSNQEVAQLWLVDLEQRIRTSPTGSES